MGATQQLYSWNRNKYKNKILRLFNPKEYFDKEKYNPTINKGVDENDKKQFQIYSFNYFSFYC